MVNEKDAQLSQTLVIDQNKGLLTHQQIEKMIQQEEQLEEEETIKRERLKALNDLQNYGFKTNPFFFKLTEMYFA